VPFYALEIHLSVIEVYVTTWPPMPTKWGGGRTDHDMAADFIMERNDVKSDRSTALANVQLNN